MRIHSAQSCFRKWIWRGSIWRSCWSSTSVSSTRTYHSPSKSFTSNKKVIDRSDRFIAFSSVDPRRGKEGVELFEKVVSEWGFRGLKVYSPCGFSPSDKRMFPYYEICSQRRLPVLTHVGPSSASLSFKRSNPLGVDDAALNFPKVN